MRSFLLLALLSTTLQAKDIVIRAARILDGRGNIVRNAAVVVNDSKILRIDPRPQRADIDLGDRTLMPGGIDTHVHIGWHFDKNGRSNDDGEGERPAEYALYAEENAWNTLMGGVTTVQSLGAPIDKTIADFGERTSLPLPRILTSLEPITDNKLTSDQLREEVRKRAADGANVIKIFASQSIRSGGGPTMSQEQMDALCGEAKKLGLRTAVHEHGPESVKGSFLAGGRSFDQAAALGQAASAL